MTRRWRPAACVVGLMAAVATAVGAQPAVAKAPQASSGCQKAPPPYRRFVATIGVHGVQRTALVNVPPGQPARKPLPLVLMFHGAGSDGRGTESSIGLSAVGNRYGVITAYPNAYGKYWNLTGRGYPGQADI